MTQQFKPGDICVIISATHQDGARNIGKRVEFCQYTTEFAKHDCQVKALEPVWGWVLGSAAIMHHPAGMLMYHLAQCLRLLRDPDAELPAPPVEKEIQT